MGQKRPGDAVNIEFDVIARYIDRLLACGKGAAGNGRGGTSLLEHLEGAGF
jgi:riboflavin synthase alpha subunit